ncbi:unnamed protein product [Ectocarpus sp. 12 AP-2014]
MIVRKALMLLLSLVSAATDCCTIDPKLTSLRGGGGRQAWIQDFCRTPGNEFFAEVPLSFIRESMNSIDIGRGVDIPYRQEALGVILGERRIGVGVHGDNNASTVQSSAALLYGLLHARFLVSPQGLKVVLEKFSKADFGRCPRYTVLQRKENKGLGFSTQQKSEKYPQTAQQDLFDDGNHKIIRNKKNQGNAPNTERP